MNPKKKASKTAPKGKATSKRKKRAPQQTKEIGMVNRVLEKIKGL